MGAYDTSLLSINRIDHVRLSCGSIVSGTLFLSISYIHPPTAAIRVRICLSFGLTDAVCSVNDNSLLFSKTPR